jgi:hypothetical protein
LELCGLCVGVLYNAHVDCVGGGDSEKGGAQKEGVGETGHGSSWLLMMRGEKGREEEAKVMMGVDEFRFQKEGQELKEGQKAMVDKGLVCLLSN